MQPDSTAALLTAWKPKKPFQHILLIPLLIIARNKPSYHKTNVTGHSTMTQTTVLSVFFFPFRALWSQSFTASSTERQVPPRSDVNSLYKQFEPQDIHTEISHMHVVLLRECSSSVFSLWLPQCSIYINTVLIGGQSCEYESPVAPAVSPPSDLLSAYFFCALPTGWEGCKKKKKHSLLGSQPFSDVCRSSLWADQLCSQSWARLNHSDGLDGKA